MKNKKHSIHFLAGIHISRLFARELPSELLFHNFHHTANVVRGVREISKNLQLENHQKEILLLAAWFHDSGFTRTCKGHEIESQKIAENFLVERDYPREKLNQVLFCIGATKMPQQPINLLQEVLCDADLYHLSLLEYIHLQFMLREEWVRTSQVVYSDRDWKLENLKFLENHKYFTSYGQDVLQKRKQMNIDKCQELLTEESSTSIR